MMKIFGRLGHLWDEWNKMNQETAIRNIEEKLESIYSIQGFRGNE